MPEDHSFDALMARIRQGDESAAAAVFRVFGRKLIRLARQHLGEALRAKTDPEDVVQSAYRSFFIRTRAGQFEIDNWKALWGLLTVITLRKCVNRAKYFQAERRDVGREVPASATESQTH